MPDLGRQRHPAFFIPKKYHEEYDRVIILARIGKPVYKKVSMDVDDEHEGDAEEADQGLPTDGRVEDADDEDGGGGNDEGWEDTERSDYEPDLKRRKLTARRKGLRSQSRRPGAPKLKSSGATSRRHSQVQRPAVRTPNSESSQGGNPSSPGVVISTAQQGQ